MLPYFSSRRTGVECPASGSWVFRADGTRTRRIHQRNERAAGCNADTFRKPYRPDSRARSRKARPPQRLQSAIRFEDHPKHVSSKTTRYEYRGALAPTCPPQQIASIHVLGPEERRFREQTLDTRSTDACGGTPQKDGWIREAAFRNASNRAKPRLDGERRHRSDHRSGRRRGDPRLIAGRRSPVLSLFVGGARVACASSHSRPNGRASTAWGT
jgi:hypothetical protein